jgi:glycine dehydrogenase
MNPFEQQQHEFTARHIGPDASETAAMLHKAGEASLASLVDKTVPSGIRMDHELNIPPAMSEHDYLQHIKELSLKNKTFRNHIGQGYYGTIVPSVILRNVFENPGWYTQYTPYQAEISQGRLESLLNFQTMVSDLTALPLANASLLDEATAAAEAMHLFFGELNKGDEIKKPKFFVDSSTFAQTKEQGQCQLVPKLFLAITVLQLLMKLILVRWCNTPMQPDW